jgi:hypothetical protein
MLILKVVRHESTSACLKLDTTEWAILRALFAVVHPTRRFRVHHLCRLLNQDAGGRRAQKPESSRRTRARDMYS